MKTINFNKVVIEMTLKELHDLMSCISSAEIRYIELGDDYKIMAEKADKIWSELYDIAKEYE